MIWHWECDAGTAGVWRIAALNEAGGWKDRTTVEDMDLAVRASLRGWKFVYLSDLKVMKFVKTVVVLQNIKKSRKKLATYAYKELELDILCYWGFINYLGNKIMLF